MKPMNIPTNTTYVDAAEERRIQLSGALIMLNRGNINPRWVDVMPQVVADPWAGRIHRQASKPTLDPPKVTYVMSESERLRHRINNRAAWERKRAKLRETAAERRAENERIKAAQRTPEQKKRHDDYIARKAAKETGR